MAHTRVSPEEAEGMFESIVYERGPAAGLMFLVHVNNLAIKTRENFIKVFNEARAWDEDTQIALLH